jgi:hypothetical protein
MDPIPELKVLNPIPEHKVMDPIPELKVMDPIPDPELDEYGTGTLTKIDIK